MPRLTKEQYERLTPYESALKSAYKNSFVHVTAADFIKIAEVYNEVYEPLRKGQMGCNTCRLNAMKKLGALYINYTQEEKEKEEKKATRKGRPKKLTEEVIDNNEG